MKITLLTRLIASSTLFISCSINTLYNLSENCFGNIVFKTLNIINATPIV